MDRGAWWATVHGVTKLLYFYYILLYYIIIVEYSNILMIMVLLSRNYFSLFSLAQ